MHINCQIIPPCQTQCHLKPRFELTIHLYKSSIWFEGGAKQAKQKKGWGLDQMNDRVLYGVAPTTPRDSGVRCPPPISVYIREQW